MKVILYMALTANGMIAKSDGNSEWVSPEDTEAFLSICRKAKAVVMGRHTYDYLTRGDANENLPLQEGIQVVMTSDTTIRSNDPTVMFTDKSPKEIVKIVEEKGYSEVCIMGGSTTVSVFMQEGLVDEIFFDIEPLIFGKGMPIFMDVDFEYKLKLLETRKLNENTVQLNYEVIK